MKLKNKFVFFFSLGQYITITKPSYCKLSHALSK